MAQPPPTEATKPIHTIILDSSPLLLNTPSLSTLLANGHTLVTTPSVLAEIRNVEAKSRVETLYMPFMTIRSPKPESIKFVRDFAHKTGDAAVLSQTDFEVLALAYDLECERNGGDWRLRNALGQRRLNGSPPTKKQEGSFAEENKQSQDLQPSEETTETSVGHISEGLESVDINQVNNSSQPIQAEEPIPINTKNGTETTIGKDNGEVSPDFRITDDSFEDEESAESDEGWITPSNIKKQKAKDETADDKTKTEVKTLQVATMTGDFAMQNVLLQINLNLLSTKTCKRVTQIKQFVLRCHACFNIVKDTSKQFCPRCGQPTLTRVSCTTNDKGEVKLHLKANMQWNNKGNVFSVPKPVSGSSNQKWKGPKQGGGQGGWGSDLILAEDQKEYIRAMTSKKKTKDKDLMDEDTLPSILTGDRGHNGGRVRIGAGRNINSRKR